MRQVRLAVVPNVAVVQAHVLKTATQTRRMHVHLAHHRGLVSAVAHLLGQHMVVIPIDTVLVSHAAMVLGRLARKQPGARRNAAGAGGIRVFKQHAVGRQRIQIGRLHVRMPINPQAVATELIAHHQQHIRTIRGRRSIALPHRTPPSLFGIFQDIAMRKPAKRLRAHRLDI